MNEDSFDKHIEVDKLTVQVQALTSRANLALDTLNYLNVSKDRGHTPHRSADLEKIAVESLINYFGQG